MKFSTTFTLATLAVLSIGSEARIGRSLEAANPVLSATESLPNDFPVYIASPCGPDSQVGLLDQNKDPYNPISKFSLGDAGCVQVGVISDHDYYNNTHNSVNYMVENNHAGARAGNANCTDIGNKNNLKCGLPDGVPENACVIVDF